MKKTSIFRSLCMVMAWVYSTVAVHAGQVVTQEERTWAKKSLSLAESEKNLAPVSATNTLGVLYFNNKTGLEDLNTLQKGMAIMLITDLAKVDKIQVVERIKIQALLDEMNLGASGLVDPSSAPKVGKILGAYYISSGNITLGKMAQLNINPILVDVPFKTVTEQKAASGNSQDIFRMEKEILFGIIDQMKVFLTPKERDELNKPLAASPVAALAFFAGVDLSDKGKYAEAAKMYEKAVLEDDNFTLAKDALQELRTLGLTSSAEAVKEGSSTGTITLVTLGVLAVGGGVALALSGGGSDSSSSTTPPSSTTPTPTDTTGPVISAASPGDGGTLSPCSDGTLQFSSNETLKSGSCSATISSSNSSFGWTTGDVDENDKVLDVKYAGGSYICTYAATMTVTISGCQDTIGNPMTEKSFSFKTGK